MTAEEIRVMLEQIGEIHAKLKYNNIPYSEELEAAFDKVEYRIYLLIRYKLDAEEKLKNKQNGI